MKPEVTVEELKTDLSKFLRWTWGELVLVERALCRFCRHLPVAFPGHAACGNCEKEHGHG